MELVEFLAARIGEDERRWANPAFAPVAGVGLSALVMKMRAECAAKRTIVERYRAELADPQGIAEDAWREACLVLAGIWADHPDFDQRWRL